jgi:hypothetical protein
MRLILSTIIIVTSLHCYSQTLTNRQVYDFEVGDVFQVYYTSGMSGGQFRDTIKSKYYSINNDTVFYQKNSVGISSSNPNYVYSSSIKFYTNLDSVASHIYFDQCTTSPPPSDTLFQSSQYCNQLTWRRTTNHDLDCFEDNSYTSELIAGCGGPYHVAFIGIGGPASYEYRLTYFKKDTVSCGNAFSTNVDEINLLNSINIYPNPSNSTIQVSISNNISIKKYSISTVSGQIIGDYIFSNIIDISNLKSGVYFFTFLSFDNLKITKKIIKE